jgi:hypothetical protein
VKDPSMAAMPWHRGDPFALHTGPDRTAGNGAQSEADGGAAARTLAVRALKSGGAAPSGARRANAERRQPAGTVELSGGIEVRLSEPAPPWKVVNMVGYWAWAAVCFSRPSSASVCQKQRKKISCRCLFSYFNPRRKIFRKNTGVNLAARYPSQSRREDEQPARQI